MNEFPPNTLVIEKLVNVEKNLQILAIEEELSALSIS